MRIFPVFIHVRDSEAHPNSLSDICEGDLLDSARRPIKSSEHWCKMAMVLSISPLAQHRAYEHFFQTPRHLQIIKPAIGQMRFGASVGVSHWARRAPLDDMPTATMKHFAGVC